MLLLCSRSSRTISPAATALWLYTIIVCIQYNNEHNGLKSDRRIRHDTFNSKYPFADYRLCYRPIVAVKRMYILHFVNCRYDDHREFVITTLEVARCIVSIHNDSLVWSILLSWHMRLALGPATGIVVANTTIRDQFRVTLHVFLLCTIRLSYSVACCWV